MQRVALAPRRPRIGHSKKQMPNRNYRKEAQDRAFQQWIKGVREEVRQKQDKIRSVQKNGRGYKNLEVCWLADHGYKITRYQR